jgi:hypothetical protein
VRGVVDIRRLYQALAAQRRPLIINNARSAGLSSVCAALLGKPLDKSMQVSDWSARPLSERQLKYAAQVGGPPGPGRGEGQGAGGKGGGAGGSWCRAQAGEEAM